MACRRLSLACCPLPPNQPTRSPRTRCSRLSAGTSTATPSATPSTCCTCSPPACSSEQRLAGWRQHGLPCLTHSARCNMEAAAGNLAALPSTLPSLPVLPNRQPLGHSLRARSQAAAGPRAGGDGSGAVRGHLRDTGQRERGRIAPYVISHTLWADDVGGSAAASDADLQARCKRVAAIPPDRHPTWLPPAACGRQPCSPASRLPPPCSRERCQATGRTSPWRWARASTSPPLRSPCCSCSGARAAMRRLG